MDCDAVLTLQHEHMPLLCELFCAPFNLEDLLRCAVNLVNQRALRAQFRPSAERDWRLFVRDMIQLCGQIFCMPKATI